MHLQLQHQSSSEVSDAALCCPKVRAYVLETIASDPGLQQAELVFLGLFGRACRILDSRDSQVRCALPVQRFRRALVPACSSRVEPVTLAI